MCGGSGRWTSWCVGVPFERDDWSAIWPRRGPGDEPWVMAVSERVRQELKERHVLFTELPRSDTPASMEAFRISGFNTGNFKPVSIVLISNSRPPEIHYEAATTTRAATAAAKRER